MRLLAPLAAVISLAAAPAAAQTFDFEDVPVGTTTPFSRTVGGLTASFSAANQATGSFTVVNLSPTFAPGVSGRALQQPTGLGALLVAFSTPLSSVTFNFATNGGSTINLLLFSGATQVGAGTFASTAAPGFSFPGGVATLGFAGGFDRISVSAQAPQTQFLMDNLAARPTQVIPEPSTVALTGAGLAALLAAARRRSRSHG